MASPPTPASSPEDVHSVHEPSAWGQLLTLPYRTGPDRTGPDHTLPDQTGPCPTPPCLTWPDLAQPDRTLPNLAKPDRTVPNLTQPNHSYLVLTLTPAVPPGGVMIKVQLGLAAHFSAA